MKTVRAIVSGRVQGVWFRARTKDKAVELGVAGTVRNLPDGTVEIVAQGEEPRVERLLDWARLGPPMAVVHEVKLSEPEEDREYSSFEVVY